jgi:hypothetical protein
MSLFVFNWVRFHSNPSGTYVDSAGASRLTLRRNGTGHLEFGTRMAGYPASPFDGGFDFTYDLQGDAIRIHVIDPATGKPERFKSKGEEAAVNFVMDPIMSGTVSSDRRAVTVMGDTFVRP